MEKTLSFSLQRTWWLLRLNGRLSKAWEVYWWLAMVGLALCLAAFRKQDEMQTLCLMVAGLTIFYRLFFFYYGLKFQTDASYLNLPVSRLERFVSQLMLTLVLGAVYACLLVLFFVGARNVFALISPEYDPLGIGDMFQWWATVFTELILPNDLYNSMGGYFLSLGCLTTFWLALVCLFPRMLAFWVFMACLYLWADLRIWLIVHTNVFDFFKANEWCAVCMHLALTAFFLWFAYRRFGRITLKKQI